MPEDSISEGRIHHSADKTRIFYGLQANVHAALETS
jgi:hypothetical protein